MAGLLSGQPNDGMMGSPLVNILGMILAPKVMGGLNEQAQNRYAMNAKQEELRRRQEAMRQGAGLLSGPDGPQGSRSVAPKLAGLLADAGPEAVNALLSLAQAQDPKVGNINGFAIDERSPEAVGKFFPKIPEGMRPNEQGGVANLPGLTEAMFGQTAATENAKRAAEYNYAGKITGAQEAARAPYQDVRVPLPGGGDRVMSRAQFAGEQGDYRSQSPADTEYQKATATAAADRFVKIQTAAQSAPAKIAKLQQIEALLGDFEGGKFAPAGLEIASALNSLGFQMDSRMSNAQAADALAKQMALELRDPSTGGGMPGNLSNADRDYLGKATPGLLQSAEGRRALIKIQTRLLERNVQTADFARKWAQRYGRLDATDAKGKSFEDYLSQWAAQNRMFE